MERSLIYISELKATLDRLSHEKIEQVIDVLHEARMKENKIFVMGNGGSASTANHMVCDLAKNTRKPGWPAIKIIGLSDNMAIFSALANDEGYENVFSQQLANLLEPKDIVIAISASGNSRNVIKAVQLANEAGATTIGFTGFDGGKLGQMVDIQLHVPSDCIEHVEDIHLMLEHLIVQALRDLTGNPEIQIDPGLPNARRDC
jgi:D-sedoheptulose 7-phosphate isomerase